MRASYKFGVRWIAENDEPIAQTPEDAVGLISILLLADLFGKTPEIVARDVFDYKNKMLVIRDVMES
jgi:hypothetical protein